MRIKFNLTERDLDAFEKKKDGGEKGNDAAQEEAEEEV